MGILYFWETNKLYSTEMDNKSVQKKALLNVIYSIETKVVKA